MKHLCGSENPEMYFKHPQAFPMLLLPWWAEKSILGRLDTDFQSSIVNATINGYYYIRLIDNLMDGHATVELELLSALGIFHTDLLTALHPYFEHGHEFWDFFSATSLQSAEFATVDAQLTDISRKRFVEVAAKKTCGAKVPVAAVCFKNDCPELIEQWTVFIDLLGCWHLMLDDVFDWSGDFERQTPSYFLSEAKRQKKIDESVPEWILREGFEWGVENVRDWIDASRSVAQELRSPDLMVYLDTRDSMLLRRKKAIADALGTAAKTMAKLNQHD